MDMRVPPKCELNAFNDLSSRSPVRLPVRFPQFAPLGTVCCTLHQYPDTIRRICTD